MAESNPLYGHVKKRWTEDERREFWQSKKAEKRTKSKTAREAIKVSQKKEWESLTSDQQAQVKADAATKYESKRLQQTAERELIDQNLKDPSIPRLVFDLQFEASMDFRGVKSSITQIKYSYATLKKNCFALRPWIYAPSADSSMLKSFREYEGFLKYPVPEVVGSVELLKTDMPNLVYLTADSDTILWTLEPGASYVIGSFVDHNSKKGVTRDFAKINGIATARLPIQETVEATNLCRVLAINHVVDVLVHFRRHGSWKEAFIACLPTRRQNLAENADD